MDRKNITGKSAFSLIETLIVIAITLLMLLVTIPRLHSYRIKSQLRTTTNEFKTQLGQVRTWSTAVKAGTALPPGTTDFNTRMVAYAVHVETDSNIYTAWEVWENSVSERATFDGTHGEGILDTPEERKIHFELPQDIQIIDITPANSDIYFEIPHGKCIATFDVNGQIIITLQFKTQTQSLIIFEHGNIQ